MKKAIFLLLALTAATPALAQRAPDHDDRGVHDGDRHDGDHARGDRRGGDARHDQGRGGRDGDRGPRPGESPDRNRNPGNRHQARPYLRPNGARHDAAPRPAAGGGWERRGDDRRGQSWQTPRPPGWHPDDRGPGYRGSGGYHGSGYRGPGDERRGDWDRGDHRPGGWDRNWRGDRRYDWQRYRTYNRERFRGPRYFAPRGYGYRQWYPGLRIEPFFYGRNYWISDPYDYRLPPPPPGARWVRYYNDIALINVYDGTVLDVIQGFFY